MFDLAVLLFLVLLFYGEDILEDLNEDVLFIITGDSQVVIADTLFDIVGLKFIVEDTDIHRNANRVILFIFTLGQLAFSFSVMLGGLDLTSA